MNIKQKILLTVVILEWVFVIDIFVNGLKQFHVLILALGIFGLWAVYKDWARSDLIVEDGE